MNMTSEMETKCTQTEFTCDGEGSDFICSSAEESLKPHFADTVDSVRGWATVVRKF